MSLRLAPVQESARSTLDCGGSTPLSNNTEHEGKGGSTSLLNKDENDGKGGVEPPQCAPEVAHSAREVKVLSGST
jgi:hypothetical protein